MTGSVIYHGHCLYGYTDIRCNKDGRAGYEINPKEAEILRLIYRRCAEGMSIGGIPRELTKLAVPTPGERYPVQSFHKLRGQGEWGRSTIQSILQNEGYAGSWYYGKYGPKAPNSRQAVRNDRKTWIEVEIPAIIDADLWQATRRILKKNKERGGGKVKND